MHASRQALEESVRNALRSAEELAQLSRRQRAEARSQAWSYLPAGPSGGADGDGVDGEEVQRRAVGGGIAVARHLDRQVEALGDPPEPG